MTTRIEGANSYQAYEPNPQETDNQKEEISLEVANGTVEMMIETIDKFGDESFTVAHMNREQLWEHVHNCLNALEGLK
jgi:hypothetical protein